MYKKCNIHHTISDFIYYLTLMIRRRKYMSNPKKSISKSQKIHQNWTSDKHQKSQQNGETEITLHNRILRTEAKAKQL